MLRTIAIGSVAVGLACGSALALAAGHRGLSSPVPAAPILAASSVPGAMRDGFATTGPDAPAAQRVAAPVLAQPLPDSSSARLQAPASAFDGQLTRTAFAAALSATALAPATSMRPFARSAREAVTAVESVAFDRSPLLAGTGQDRAPSLSAPSPSAPTLTSARAPMAAPATGPSSVVAEQLIGLDTIGVYR